MNKSKADLMFIIFKTFIFLAFGDDDDTEFEDGFGMWYNSNNDKLNWQRHQGFTKTVETGPNADHTLGKFLLAIIICKKYSQLFLALFCL